MVKTSAWPTLLGLAALQLAIINGEGSQHLFELISLETDESVESVESIGAKTGCPRLSAATRSLSLELKTDATCAGTTRATSTCYNTHCRVCYTQITDLNKSFVDKLVNCASLDPKPAAVVSPVFDPATIPDPITSPTDPSSAIPVTAPAVPVVAPGIVPTDAPVNPSEAPIAPVVVPPVGTADAPTAPAVAPPADTTDTPVTSSVAPVDTTNAPVDPSVAPADPSVAPSVVATDAPVAPSVVTTDAPVAPVIAPPVVPTDTITDAPAGPVAPSVFATDAPTVTLPTDTPTAAPATASGLVTATPVGDKPWTPEEPTYPSGSGIDEPSTVPNVTAPIVMVLPANATSEPSTAPSVIAPAVNTTTEPSKTPVIDGSNDSSTDSDSSHEDDTSSDSSRDHHPGYDLCAGKLSEGDHEGGVRVITDTNCISGGLGCFDYVCRYCKIHESAVSSQYFKCSSFGYHYDGDDWDDTADSGSIDVDASTDGSEVDEPTAGEGSDVRDNECFKKLSLGDHEAGIRLIPDAKCRFGGLGCFEMTCRYCKIVETDKSKHLFKCENFGFHFVGDEFMGGSGSIDETPGPVPPSKPVDDEPTNTEPPVVSLPEAPTIPPPTCDSTISPGDAAVGIDMVTDPSCASGGLGCFGDMCRLCKVRVTNESDHLSWCTDVLAAVNPEAPTTAPATGTDVVSPVVATTDPCVAQVSSGDQDARISAITDASCHTGGLGCFSDVCRFCKLDIMGPSQFFPCSQFAPRSTSSFFHAAAAVLTETSGFFTKTSHQVPLVILGCIGAVAMVAVIAIGVARGVRHMHSAMDEEIHEDADADDDDDDDVEAVEPPQPSAQVDVWSTDSPVLSTA